MKFEYRRKRGGFVFLPVITFVWERGEQLAFILAWGQWAILVDY